MKGSGPNASDPSVSSTFGTEAPSAGAKLPAKAAKSSSATATGVGPAATPSASAISLTSATPGDLRVLALYLGSQAETSRKTRASHVRLAARLWGLADPSLVPWCSVTYEAAAALRHRLSTEAGPRYGRAVMGTVRGILNAAWLAGLYDFEDLSRVRALPRITGTPAQAGRYVSHVEVRALFDACAEAPGSKAKRDRAILALLFGAGLRRSEVGALDTDDIQTEAPPGGVVRVESGKGRKGRDVPIGASTVAHVHAWTADPGGPSPWCPFAFAMRKGGRPREPRAGISGEGIRLLLARLCDLAGIATVRPHDARRTYASNLLGAGVDIAIAARLMGHASITQTAAYDRRGHLEMVEAAGVVRLPVY